MVGGRANRAAVFSGDAIRLLHAHKGELLYATPDQAACFLIERLNLVAFLDVNDFRFVIFILAFCVLASPAQSRIGRYTQAIHRERAADGGGGLRYVSALECPQSREGGSARNRER